MKNGLSVRNMHYSLEGFDLKNISFELEQGYILGLIGRNGSGKTTLLRSLLTMYSPEYEEINLDGTDISEEAPFKEKIAFILESNPFCRNLTPKFIGKNLGKFYKSFDYEAYRARLSEYEVPEKVPMDELSAGQLIRQQLAFALSRDASLYIMDEPVGNLDPDFRKTFYDEVRKMIADGRKSVIISSHSITELDGLIDYVLWLKRKEDESEICFNGSIDELKAAYRIVEGDAIKNLDKAAILGGRIRDNHKELLVRADAIPNGSGRYASLKEIMYYVEKGAII